MDSYHISVGENWGCAHHESASKDWPQLHQRYLGVPYVSCFQCIEPINASISSIDRGKEDWLTINEQLS